MRLLQTQHRTAASAPAKRHRAASNGIYKYPATSGVISRGSSVSNAPPSRHSQRRERHSEKSTIHRYQLEHPSFFHFFETHPVLNPRHYSPSTSPPPTSLPPGRVSAGRLEHTGYLTTDRLPCRRQCLPAEQPRSGLITIISIRLTAAPAGLLDGREGGREGGREAEDLAPGVGPAVASCPNRGRRAIPLCWFAPWQLQTHLTPVRCRFTRGSTTEGGYMKHGTGAPTGHAESNNKPLALHPSRFSAATWTISRSGRGCLRPALNEQRSKRQPSTGRIL